MQYYSALLKTTEPKNKAQHAAVTTRKHYVDILLQCYVYTSGSTAKLHRRDISRWNTTLKHVHVVKRQRKQLAQSKPNFKGLITFTEQTLPALQITFAITTIWATFFFCYQIVANQ